MILFITQKPMENTSATLVQWLVFFEMAHMKSTMLM